MPKIRGIYLSDQPCGMDEYLLASMGRLTYVAANLKANNASCMANPAGVN